MMYPINKIPDLQINKKSNHHRSFSFSLGIQTPIEQCKLSFSALSYSEHVDIGVHESIYKNHLLYNQKCSENEFEMCFEYIETKTGL